MVAEQIMARNEHKCQFDGKPETTSLRTMKIKIRELQFGGHLSEQNALLRIGWSSSHMSVYTRWKRVTEQGKVGWKNSLVQTVSSCVEEITLIIYQKVGFCEMPVGMRRVELPIHKVRDKCTCKFFFSLPVQEMRNSPQVLIAGEVKLCQSEEKTKSPNVTSTNISNHTQRDKDSHNNNTTTEGSTASMSTESCAGRSNASIDMSIDLTQDMPTVFFPLMSTQEIYGCVILKHFDMIHESGEQLLFISILRSILSWENHRQPIFCSPDVCDAVYEKEVNYNFIKELDIGVCLKKQLSTEHGCATLSFEWNVQRVIDMNCLAHAIRGFIQASTSTFGNNIFQ